jgi:uncharacterized Zn-finger protein
MGICPKASGLMVGFLIEPTLLIVFLTTFPFFPACPYPECGKKFARSDNMKTHYATHFKVKRDMNSTVASNFSSTSGGQGNQAWTNSDGMLDVPDLPDFDSSVFGSGMIDQDSPGGVPLRAAQSVDFSSSMASASPVAEWYALMDAQQQQR